MLNVLKVRIYPNKEQELALAKNFGCVRFVWNYYLNKTNNQYLETGKGMTYCDMAKDLTQLKKQPNFEWLAEATAATLQQSLKNLESAFKNFFSTRTKFPKFKSKHKKQSIRYPESCSIRNNGIKLPKLGVVKAKISQVINGQIKSVTVSKTSTDKYFAAILFEMDDSTTIEKLKISGIDLGLSSLVTVFDGETTYKVDPIKPTRKYAKRLKRRQQALSRKAKGSNNRQKAVKEVAKVHEKIANTRQDFLHKLSRKLCDENQIVVAENLSIKGLARTKLAKSIHDAGFGMLLNFLDYKLEREGGKLVEVDRFYPSTKLCSCCGFKNDLLTLSIREWICPECESHHDRDENAAKNLREEGMRILSTNTDGQSEFQAWGETVRLVGTCTQKRVSVNQESSVTASAWRRECQSYYTADVFSDRIFGGNPLAVFPEASGLTHTQMQKIAAEFNFSETVFVFPPETPQGTKKVRIFTPSTELPFAGHPTVGTAYILALIGAIPPHQETTIYLEEGVGLVPVKILMDGEKPVYSELKVAQLPELVTDTYALDDLAAILSLSVADFLPGYPPRAFSCGLPFLFIPVRNRDVLGKIKLNLSLWSSLLGQSPANSLFVCCFDPESPQSRLYGRMFAPGLGVMEDPATGSAVAALAGYLGGLESSREGMNQWTIIQGVEMGRPSTIQLKFQKNNRSITEVSVGGASVLVCQGKMIIPDGETKSDINRSL